MRGGTVRALDGLDLAVEPGGVFGFLGPNGSGKTTTIRCLLGLTKPTSGSCSILGADSQTDLHHVIRRVGSIVETPALFATFTGRRNLELLATIHDIPGTRIDEVIEMVGLT
ncbi:MAG: ATP-binding cassette domain-containing protein, partial [Actinomycetota bacterium]|nr:ATP-binding cassette domain-containing protein [Actinomycetota bacterium]